MLITHVTESMRELAARLLIDVPMYAVLHESEPSAADPLATIVPMTGLVGLRIGWQADGSSLFNGADMTFSGIARRSYVSWVAICLQPTGHGLLCYGEAPISDRSAATWSTFTVKARDIEISVG